MLGVGLKKSDFFYCLPDELIAQRPAERRELSRLMRLNRNTGSISHHHFFQLPQLLREGDCLVLNDSRVIPARLRGRKDTGGAAEVLLLREAESTTVSPSSTDTKPSEAGSGRRGGATERSGCPATGEQSGAKSATTT